MGGGGGGGRREGARNGLWACHLDVANAFWSFELPREFWCAFRFEIEGEIFSIVCLLYGWKFSPSLCQRAFAHFLAVLEPGKIILLQYLDDFLFLGDDREGVRDLCGRAKVVLVEAGYIVSSKPILEPVRAIRWLGKESNLVTGSIGNGGGSIAMLLATSWVRVTAHGLGLGVP